MQSNGAITSDSELNDMKKIALTRGQFALVDDDDFDRLNQYKWYASFSRHYAPDGNYAAARMVTVGGRQRMILMHREIVNAPNGVHVDHKNRNPLDNQKVNLRLATPQQNGANRRMQKNNTSGYKGVYLRRRSGKFVAQIKQNGEHIYLGRFETAVRAAQAYDEKAKEIHGEFAVLNFPD